MNDIVYAGRHALMRSVQRHAHESWEFIYCTYGSGTFFFDGACLPYQKGDVVVIPPMVPHSNASEEGFRNIHINMSKPQLTIKEPALIQDDSNHFLLDAFSAALYHYHSDIPERTALLAAYGSLITCYLTVYQTGRRRSQTVETIEQHIISHYADSGYELDTFLHSLPFNYDYVRKLFQKEMQVTPHQYLTDRRLQAAAEMLVNAGDNAVSMADVAQACGFREPLYFSRMFKKKYGIAPSFYAQSRREAAQPSAESIKVMMTDA